MSFENDTNTKRLSYGKMKNYIIEDSISSHLDKIKISDGYAVTEPMEVTLRTNFIDGRGYMDEVGNVWIYYANIPNIKGIIPWFNVTDNKLTFGCVPTESIRKMFSYDNVRDISVETIIKETKEHEELYDEEELKFMNSATSSYTPEIDETDDFLKKVVKKVLLVLKININKFTPQFKEKYTLSNLKTALQNSTKMSVKSFGMWMELLGCDFIVVVKKSKRSTTPEELNGCVVYDSETNTIRQVKSIEFVEDDE